MKSDFLQTNTPNAYIYLVTLCGVLLVMGVVTELVTGRGEGLLVTYEATAGASHYTELSFVRVEYKATTSINGGRGDLEVAFEIHNNEGTDVEYTYYVYTMTQSGERNPITQHTETLQNNARTVFTASIPQSEIIAADTVYVSLPQTNQMIHTDIPSR